MRKGVPSKPAAKTSCAPSATGAAGDADNTNPLIDDLLEDLSTPSDSNLPTLARLQNASVSNNGSFAEFHEAAHRCSSGQSLRVHDGAKNATRQMLAVDVVCKTTQHFVHAMRMNQLDSYFSVKPGKGTSPEATLSQLLKKKKPQEVETLVMTLVEILEEVHAAYSQVAPLTGSLSMLDGNSLDRAMSSSLLSTMSTASLMRPPVHETNQVATAVDQKGNKMINCYTIIANLGQGAYGKVKLAQDMESGGNVAIKIIDKKHLKKRIGGVGAVDQDSALKREIAIMKKVRHRNCVSLYEVIDDPDSQKLYLIMDYVPNGPVVRLKPQQLSAALLDAMEHDTLVNGVVYDKELLRCAVRQRADGGSPALTEAEKKSNPTIFTCRPLKQSTCAMYLRQLVSGLRYMHKRNLVHHDIKPDNILLGSNHQVFLTDFGVSEILTSTRPHANDADDNDAANGAKEAGSGGNGDGNSSDSDSPNSTARAAGNAPRLGAGTLLFTAPELFDQSIDAAAIDPFLTDVWALGVTLYCMLVGVSPFSGNCYPDVSRNIQNETFPWNGKSLTGGELTEDWHSILSGLMEKNPKKRWTLVRLKSFLDSESFQETMRVCARRESHSRLSTSSPGLNRSRPITASTSAAPRTFGAPSVLTVNSLHHTSSSVSTNSPVTGMTVMSFPSGEARMSPLDYVWDMGLSEQDVRDATRTVRVGMGVRTSVVSEKTRGHVHAYVERIRSRMQENPWSNMATTAPYDSHSLMSTRGESHFTSTLRFTAQPSSANTRPSVVAGISGVHVSHIPVLAIAKSFHRTSAGNSVSFGGLYFPPRRTSDSKGDASAIPPLAPKAMGDTASNAGGNGGLLHRARTCASHSLDAMLSIVDLPSASQDVSSSSSSSSSFAGGPFDGAAKSGLTDAGEVSGSASTKSPGQNSDSGPSFTRAKLNTKRPTTITPPNVPLIVEQEGSREGSSRRQNPQRRKVQRSPGASPPPSCGVSDAAASPRQQKVSVKAPDSVAPMKTGQIDASSSALASAAQKRAITMGCEADVNYVVDLEQPRLSEMRLDTPIMTAWEEVETVAKKSRYLGKL